MSDAPPRRFAAGARLLAGQCALLLGWRPPEFWAATPAELAAIFAARADAAGPAEGVTRRQLETMLEREADG